MRQYSLDTTQQMIFVLKNVHNQLNPRNSPFGISMAVTAIVHSQLASPPRIHSVSPRYDGGIPEGPDARACTGHMRVSDPGRTHPRGYPGSASCGHEVRHIHKTFQNRVLEHRLWVMAMLAMVPPLRSTTRPSLFSACGYRCLYWPCWAVLRTRRCICSQEPCVPSWVQGYFKGDKAQPAVSANNPIAQVELMCQIG